MPLAVGSAWPNDFLDGGGAGVQQEPARPPLTPCGREVASASERKADAQAGGYRRPEREPQRSAAAGHAPSAIPGIVRKIQMTNS
jgi:hypothetical protein